MAFSIPSANVMVVAFASNTPSNVRPKLTLAEAVSSLKFGSDVFQVTVSTPFRMLNELPAIVYVSSPSVILTVNVP